MSPRESSLRRLATIVCCAPLLLEVVRVVLDGTASAHAMTILAAVALFALPAYLGHAWALALSPFVFLAAGMELIITTIFRAGPLHYWVLVCGLVWCGAELALAKDLRPYLREQRGDV